MTGSVPPLFAELSTITAFVGNGVVLASVVGMIGFAWKQGLFVATVVALGCLAAFVGALACVATVSRYLVDVEVSTSLAPAAAYALVLSGLLLALRAAYGRWLPEQAVWMGGLASRLGACGAGGIAGAIVAAAVLIGWTMLPLPSSLVLRSDELFWDPGPWCLRIFTRFVESDRARRDTMLGGNGLARGTASPAGSDPFFDENGNCVRDSDERFIDRDGNGQFTVMPEGVSDVAREGEWRPGLVDHYRLAAWRQVMAMHPPRISSGDGTGVEVAALAEGLYRTAVDDPDACDSFTFSIEADADEGGDPGFTIDPKTGVVMLTEREVAAPRRKYNFTVKATDRAGLFDVRLVTVTIKGLPDPPVTPSVPAAGE